MATNLPTYMDIPPGGLEPSSIPISVDRTWRVTVIQVGDSIKVEANSGIGSWLYGGKYTRYIKIKDRFWDSILGTSYEQRIDKAIIKMQGYCDQNNKNEFNAQQIAEKSQGAL